jgi:hypothetical protein
MSRSSRETEDTGVHLPYDSAEDVVDAYDSSWDSQFGSELDLDALSDEIEEDDLVEDQTLDNLFHRSQSSSLSDQQQSPHPNEIEEDDLVEDQTLDDLLHRSQSSLSDQQRSPHPNEQNNQPPRSSSYGISDSESLFEELLNLPFPYDSIPATSSHPTTTFPSVVDLTESPVLDYAAMAPSRKRRAASTHSDERPSKTIRKTPAAQGTEDRKDKSKKPEMVDLVEVENDAQYEELRLKQQAEAIKEQNEAEASRPVRLAEFQCIICMDSPTDLTVTHCGMCPSESSCSNLLCSFLFRILTSYLTGHLFCSECLHQALYAVHAKKSCPVCRTIINTTMTGRGDNKRPPKNGVFPLSMKLMTANKKGKQPVRG